VRGRDVRRPAGDEALDGLRRERRRRAAVLDEDARGRLRPRAVAERLARGDVQVDARGEHALDAPERLLELAREPGDELCVLRRLARYELAAVRGVEHAARLRARKLFLAHR